MLNYTLNGTVQEADTATNIKRRWAGSVTSGTPQEVTYVIPNTETWIVYAFYYDPSNSSSCTISLEWDGTVCWCSDTKGHKFLGLELVGDGVKEVKMKLTNDSGSSVGQTGEFELQKA
jgi:hypothetical protein